MSKGHRQCPLPPLSPMLCVDLNLKFSLIRVSLLTRPNSQYFFCSLAKILESFLKSLLNSVQDTIDSFIAYPAFTGWTAHLNSQSEAFQTGIRSDRSLDSAVVIATGYGLDVWGGRSSSPCRGNIFPLSTSSTRAHTTSYPRGYRGLFPRG
jgi:hypothetical protein